MSLTHSTTFVFVFKTVLDYGNSGQACVFFDVDQCNLTSGDINKRTNDKHSKNVMLMCVFAIQSVLEV